MGPRQHLGGTILFFGQEAEEWSLLRHKKSKRKEKTRTDFSQRPLALIWKKCWHFDFPFLNGTPILFYLSKNNCGHSKTWRLHHREEGEGKWKQLMLPQTKEGKFWTSDLMPHTNILEVRGKPIVFFYLWHCLFKLEMECDSWFAFESDI